MIVDHIGIVVRSLAEGIPRWEDSFGYRKNSDVVLNARQKVNVVFLAKPGSLTVKLIEPSDQSSPIYALAQRGGGLHHLCFRCQNLSQTVADLKAKGAVIVVPPEPGPAFNNHDIAFVFANHLNMELIDTEEKSGWGINVQ